MDFGSFLSINTARNVSDRPQDGIGNRGRQVRSHFSFHVTIRSHMDNEKVINSCELLQIASLSDVVLSKNFAA